jgi:hypothetical protein
MKILQRDNCTHLSYLKYDGWYTVERKGPLDLTGCILFTNGEALLNPPKENEVYQHFGCYPALGREK